jgi:hypothetical protein
MIPAGIMSIFVAGRMNRVLSEKSRYGEGNHGSYRPGKRNVLPGDALRSALSDEIQAGVRR